VNSQTKEKTMNEKFPLTLAAIKKGESSLWDIGDALVKECGPPSENGRRNGGLNKLEAASEYLRENGGYDYSVITLSEMRIAAFNFQVSVRRSGLSFAVHRAARTPEKLQAIIAGAAKGTKITSTYIQKVLQAQALQEEMKREADAEAARKKREKAEEKEAEAKRKAAEAKDEAERVKAAKKAKEAEEKAREARKEEKAVRTAPKPRIGPPPPESPEETTALLGNATFMANAARAERLADEARESIVPLLGVLSPAACAAMVEAALEAANSWRKLADLVKKEHGSHEHLYVVGE
jgi:hypothetical protein